MGKIVGWFVCVALGAALAGCGDDEISEAASESRGDSAIAALTRVCGPDDCLHYLYAWSEFPADQKIDRSQGIESGNTQGTVFNDAAYIFDRDSKTITRWTLDASLKLRQGAVLSFVNTGVSDLCAICNVFSTPQLAYFVDSTAGVMVTWNPTSMELIATQNLPPSVLTRDGIPAAFGWPFVHGGRAYLAAGWINYDTLQTYPKAAIATFDATVERPELSIIEDDRCGVSSVLTPFADDEGNVYMAGDWLSGQQQIGSSTPAPNPACLLRIKPGASTFDPDYYVDLLAANDARAIVGAYGMSGGKLLVNFWPTSAPLPPPAELAADPWAIFQSTVYRYAVLDLKTRTSTLVASIPPAGTMNNTPLVLDGKNYVQVYPKAQGGGEDSGSQLYEIDTDGSARVVLFAGANADFEMIGRLRAQ